MRAKLTLLAGVCAGAIAFQHEYRERTLGVPRGVDCPAEEIPEAMVDNGSWCIGSPDDLIAMIERLQAQSGGFGGFMLQPVDWATREQILSCYELVARYVMPRFQGSLIGLQASQRQVAHQAEQHHKLRSAALERAERDFKGSRG